jgi:hypothetical protein
VITKLDLPDARATFEALRDAVSRRARHLGRDRTKACAS